MRGVCHQLHIRSLECIHFTGPGSPVHLGEIGVILSGRWLECGVRMPGGAGIGQAGLGSVRAGRQRSSSAACRRGPPHPGGRPLTALSGDCLSVWGPAAWTGRWGTGENVSARFREMVCVVWFLMLTAHWACGLGESQNPTTFRFFRFKPVSQTRLLPSEMLGTRGKITSVKPLVGVVSGT